MIICIIGLGKQGKKYLRACLSTNSSTSDKIITCDMKLPEGFLSEYPEVYNYKNIDALLESHKPEACIICLPHHQYMTIMKKVSNRNIHILKEKPLARDLNEATELLSLIKSNSKNMISCERRFDKDYQHIVSNLPHADKIQHIEFRYTFPFTKAQNQKTPWRLDHNLSGGGVLLDMGYHIIDLLHWLTQEKSPQIDINSASFVDQPNASTESAAYLSLTWKHSSGKKTLINILLNSGYDEKLDSTRIFTKNRTYVIKKNDLRIFGEKHQLVFSKKREPKNKRFENQLAYFIDRAKKNSAITINTPIEHLNNTSLISEAYKHKNTPEQTQPAKAAEPQRHKANLPVILGGKASQLLSRKHATWPPPPEKKELLDIIAQRRKDINITGRTSSIKTLEDNFLSYLKSVKYAITYNSGTSALRAAYVAIAISTGDEVICPALTFHAAISPIIEMGGVPVFTDINLTTRCIDEREIEAKITKRTKAIVAVHQWGHPANMHAILKIAKKHNLNIIEDCSHAHGSKLGGQLCGTFGDIAVFSLQAKKVVYAGEGGILITNQRKLHDRATLYGHYRDRARDEIMNPSLQKYWVTGFGMKLRMSPLNAIVAIHALANLEHVIAERNTCMYYFTAKLKQFTFLRFIIPAKDAVRTTWYGFKPLYIAENFFNINIDDFVKLARVEGLKIKRPSSQPLPSLPFFSDDTNPLTEKKNLSARGIPATLFHSKNRFPNTQQVGAKGLSFPIFSNWINDRAIIDSYILTLKKLVMHGENIGKFMRTRPKGAQPQKIRASI